MDASVEVFIAPMEVRGAPFVLAYCSREFSHDDEKSIEKQIAALCGMECLFSSGINARKRSVQEVNE